MKAEQENHRYTPPSLGQQFHNIFKLFHQEQKGLGEDRAIQVLKERINEWYKDQLTELEKKVEELKQSIIAADPNCKKEPNVCDSVILGLYKQVVKIESLIEQKEGEAKSKVMQFFGKYSETHDLISIHRTEEGANGNIDEMEREIGFYVDFVTIHN